MAQLSFEPDLPCRPSLVGGRWGAQEESSAKLFIDGLEILGGKASQLSALAVAIEE